MQPSTFTARERTAGPGKTSTVGTMHPIERLRWVARAPESDVSLAAAEAAAALAEFAGDPAGLVIACRRLIERRPACAPLWWVASRVLCALDPGVEADQAAAELERDPTPGILAGELPGGTVAVAGWPEQAGNALRLRARRDGPSEDRSDRVVVVSGGRPGWRFVEWLESAGVDARLVGPNQAAKAGRRAVLVLLEAHAAGPAGFLTDPGSEALARAAREAGRPVWLVAGVGRRLPGPLYDALLARVGEPAGLEVLALDLVDEVAGPGGLAPVGATGAAAPPACPVAAELLRFRS